MFKIPIKPIEHTLELRFNIVQNEALFIEQAVAAFAIPLQAVEFTRASLALNHQTDAVSRAHRVMRHVRRQKQYVTGSKPMIDDASRFNRAQSHGALELVEELFRRIDVEVFARVGPANDHDDELAVEEKSPVADRRF